MTTPYQSAVHLRLIKKLHTDCFLIKFSRGLKESSRRPCLGWMGSVKRGLGSREMSVKQGRVIVCERIILLSQLSKYLINISLISLLSRTPSSFILIFMLPQHLFLFSPSSRTASCPHSQFLANFYADLSIQYSRDVCPP